MNNLTSMLHPECRKMNGVPSFMQSHLRVELSQIGSGQEMNLADTFELGRPKPMSTTLTDAVKSPGWRGLGQVGHQLFAEL